MKDLHPFGPHFKLWRTRRNYSLKEAAGSVISPQFLSQFEKGDKNISLENFNRLLISIGVDWTDFLADYPGEQFLSAQKEFNNLRTKPTGMFNWGAFNQELQEKLDAYYTDNPFLKEIFFKWLNLSVNRLDKEQLSKYDFSVYINYLLERQDYLNTYEGQLLLILSPLMPIKPRLKYAKKVLKDLKESCDTLNYAKAYRFTTDIDFLAATFSSEGLYLKAQELIDEARNTIHANPLMSNLLQIRLTYLDFCEVYNWLRQDKEEAIPRTRELLELCDTMIKYFPHNNWQMTKQDLIHGFNTLNKTGKLLYDDEN